MEMAPEIASSSAPRTPHTDQTAAYSATVME